MAGLRERARSRLGRWLGEPTDVGELNHRRLVHGRAIDTGELAKRTFAVGRQLNAVREPLPEKVTYVVWQLPFPACTVPGRYVYVMRDVAECLRSEDALAFVVAHEMAHHDLGHLGGRLGTHPAGHAIAGAVANGVRLLFGPQLELSADARALELCERAGFDAERCLDALRLFADDQEPPKMFRSHPPIRERLERLGASA